MRLCVCVLEKRLLSPETCIRPLECGTGIRRDRSLYSRTVFRAEQLEVLRRPGLPQSLKSFCTPTRVEHDVVDGNRAATPPKTQQPCSKEKRKDGPADPGRQNQSVKITILNDEFFLV